MNHHRPTFPAPEPLPANSAALAECDRLDALLIDYAALLRIVVKEGELLGNVAYDLARTEERKTGFSVRVRAHHQVANAYAAIYRARESANGWRSRQTTESLLNAARRETEDVRVVIVKVR